MSKRNRREHGRILSVETKNRGDSLADDFAAGVTSITVNDAGDFDEDGGWLYVGAQTVEYLECDDDTGVITLADPLAAAAEQGDPVSLWSDLYGEVVDYQLALVELDGEYDNPDPVAAEVAEGVGELSEGDRGKAGESCTLLRVADDEWEVVGVGGRPRRSQGIRFEQDDTYTLTATDVTAASATLSLSHRPIDEALTCVLAGVPQRPTNWTINYNAQTLTVPLSGWERAGDALWAHYAYRNGIATTSIQPPPTTYLGGAAKRGTTEAAVTVGPLVAGDIVVMAGGSVRGGIPGPRGTGWTTLDTRSLGSTLNVGLWYRIVGATDPTGTFYVDSSNVAMASAVAVRGATLGNWICTTGTAGAADFAYTDATVATTGALRAALAISGTNDAFVGNPEIRLPIEVEVAHDVQGYGSAATGREVNAATGAGPSRTGHIYEGPGAFAVYAVALEPQES